jgi:hypothetical protein
MSGLLYPLGGIEASPRKLGQWACGLGGRSLELPQGVLARRAAHRGERRYDHGSL